MESTDQQGIRGLIRRATLGRAALRGGTAAKQPCAAAKPPPDHPDHSDHSDQAAKGGSVAAKGGAQAAKLALSREQSPIALLVQNLAAILDVDCASGPLFVVGSLER